TMFGDRSLHSAVIRDARGINLGASPGTKQGTDFVSRFAVTRVEGAHPNQPDDTISLARTLGNLEAGKVMRVAGFIGDDPTDPVAFNPNDVDLYQFTISGPGQFAFVAEA